LVGMILQDCLEQVRFRGEDCRFLFLAPGASNFDAFNDAIGFRSIEVSETSLSPVVQNRIVVTPKAGDDNSIELVLLSEDRRLALGTIKAERGFANPKTRLAAVAIELGRQGRSLVYGTGPAHAEKIAKQISSGLESVESESLKALSEFIRKHVHPKFGLVSNVLKGVGVHYGKMPGLLRESLEEAFKVGDLNYLVCTTTLFQGVNLPARNVFIDTPTRGKGEKLEAAELWNFAGRAGRLGKDIVGNVFLVDYESWDEKPLTNRTSFSIEPSFRHSVSNNFDLVMSRIKNEVVDDLTSKYTPSEAAAGLLISRAAKGNVEIFVNRTLGDSIPSEHKDLLVYEAKSAFKRLQLPIETVGINWTVNPYGQSRLLDRFRKAVEKGDIDAFIPLHPLSVSGDVYRNYLGVFSRINKYIIGNNNSKFSNKLSGYALDWMKGHPLPVI
ncbi:MAG: DEAD/DEAH box helicase, partial [Proteobacteria bacterium]